MSDNRARIWFSLFVLAVFCVGGAGGFLLGRHLPPPGRPGDMIFGHFHPGRVGPAVHPMDAPPGPPAVLPPPEMLAQMEDQLGLDVSQRAQVQKIFDERGSRLEQLHRDAQAQFEREARELHAAIRAILRPDQQQKFDRFLQQRHMQ